MLTHMISDTLRLIDKDSQIAVKDGMQPSIISPKTLFKTSVPTNDQNCDISMTEISRTPNDQHYYSSRFQDNGSNSATFKKPLFLHGQIKIIESNFKDVISHFIDSSNTAFAHCISADQEKK